ncbi:MAG: CBS domain-containing protein [Cyanobacteria bacterium J06607_15]
MMQAQEIMTKNVLTISGSATVAEAVEIMKEKSLRALIVDRRSDSDPYGIITETDIVYKVAAFGHDPKKMRVYEIMTKPCIIVNPDLGVEYVARLFANTRIRRAPVVKGELLGVISISDILNKSDFVEKPKSEFELYCEENPSALEARMYD